MTDTTETIWSIDGVKVNLLPTQVRMCVRCDLSPRTTGSYCHPCAKELARGYRKTRDNRGRICNQCHVNKITSRTGFKCAECTTELSRVERAAYPELGRSRFLWQRYGLTLQTYNNLLETQNGVCAICHKPPKGKHPLVVDHDHACCPGFKTCGKCIRALLCVYCNSTVGKLEGTSFEPHLRYIEMWKEARSND